jgi:hypothetical protein
MPHIGAWRAAINKLYHYMKVPALQFVQTAHATS